MDINTNPPAAAVGRPKRTWVVLAIAAAALLIAAVWAIPQFKKQQHVNEIGKNIPSYFYLDPNAKREAYTAQDTKDYYLLSEEQLQEGVRYAVAKPQTAAVKEVTMAMQQQGWLAIGGSTGSATSTTIKMNNGSQSLFIRFEGGTGNEANTTVIILPVSKDK